MSRSERDKGKRGEQEVCQVLRGVFPDVRTKRAGGETARQDRGRDILGTPGWCFQVKRREKLNVSEALAEAKSAAGEEVPAVAHRRNGEVWNVTLPLYRLVEILSVGMGGGGRTLPDGVVTARLPQATARSPHEGEGDTTQGEGSGHDADTDR